MAVHTWWIFYAPLQRPSGMQMGIAAQLSQIVSMIARQACRPGTYHASLAVISCTVSAACMRCGGGQHSVLATGRCNAMH